MSDVSVIGLGKLGAVLAAVLARNGHEVIGVDLDERAVDSINQKRAPVSETGLGRLISELPERALVATTNAKLAVAATDVTFVIVPTPSKHDGGFDLRYVLAACKEIGAGIEKVDDWKTIVICSTVMPGSTGGPIREALERASGRVAGVDFGLCYSPEFIALGSVIWDMTHPDLVLLGADDERSRKELAQVLVPVFQTLPRIHELSLVDAEVAKLAVNTYVTMKISFANTIGEICEALPGANGVRVAEAIGSDSRIGPRYLRPGGAFGGPCFPRDNQAFAALARDAGVGAELAAATDVVNLRQAERLVSRLRNHDSVSVLGLSYKPATAVTERSFGLHLVESFQLHGIKVAAFDPSNTNDLTLNGSPPYQSAQSCVNENGVVVIATAHPEFADLDYRGKTVIDVWGLLPPGPNVHHIGVNQ